MKLEYGLQILMLLYCYHPLYAIYLFFACMTNDGHSLQVNLMWMRPFRTGDFVPGASEFIIVRLFSIRHLDGRRKKYCIRSTIQMSWILGRFGQWWRRQPYKITNRFSYIPFRTWTLTVLGFACVGKHVYFPESDILAFCMSKYDVVTSPFSVITDTPPRGES